MLSAKKFNKIILGLTMVSLFFVFVSIRAVNAQAGVVPDGSSGFNSLGQSVQVSSAQLSFGQKMQNIFNKALDTLRASLAKAGSLAFQRGLTTMLNTLAYDAANYVANGMTGQKAAFEQRSFGELFKDSLDAAAGDFLSTLGEEGFGGLNLCEPTLGLDIRIGLGLRQFQRPRPECTFSEMRKNWETELRDPNFLTNFQDYFEPTSNDLGIALSANTMFFQKQADDATAKLEEYKMNQGWLNVRNLAGDTKTPASLIQASTEADLIKKPEDVVKFTGDALIDAVNIFLNQLAIQLLRNLLYGGLTSGSRSSNDLYSFSADSSAGGGTAAAKDQFRKIVQPRFDVRGDYDILAELTLCADPTKAGPTNCVITEKFRQAVQERKTVGQAMTEGMLNAGGTFGFSKFNEEPRYQDENYPYRSMLILRKFRIIPVGWEVAASYINENINKLDKNDKPVLGKQIITLKDLVGCFADDDKYSGDIDTQAWCEGLVDPNWVLKAPLNYCAREGYGPETFGEAQISADGSYNIQRKDNYCADEQACVKENADGSCEVYGYCTEERRAWNFGSNSCNPLYNTCQTFTASDGSSASYLKNTLSWCASDGAGCEAYATKYNFSASKWDNGAEIYLNDKTGACDSASEGCREFWRIDKNIVESLAALPNSGDTLTEEIAKNYYNSTTTVYEKLLPSYLIGSGETFAGICYDAEGKEKADAPAICNNFVRQCSKDEVSCEKYTRVRDSFSVPAKITASDYCPQVCDGYDMHIQTETTFEAPKSQNFIPETADACNAQGAGCDQFTNLDEVAKGGEGIEYYSVLRQCITDGAQAATFYTWEGSDETGFQLRAFSLKNNSNRPAVFDTGVTGEDHTINSVNVCNADIFNRTASDPFYNSDCRQFYAKNGTISYRLYTHTISFDTNCHPYRRSEPIESGSDDVDKCTAMGGEFTGNSCIFMAIPGEGVTCNASENKCREYKGNVSNNIRVALADDFEKGVKSDWTSDNSGTGVDYSGEASKTNYHSLKISKVSGVSQIKKTVGDLINSGGAYNKSFSLEMMIKGIKDGSIKPAFKYGSDSKSFGEDTFSGEWQTFYFNLKFSDLEKYIPDAADKIIIESSASEYFIDYIILRETAETYYLIKDSWVTPEACTEDMQGCYEYRDRADKTYYLKSFSGLCSESGVGCELMIDTQNYSPREGKTFGTGAATVAIPEDKFIYVVYDEDKVCGAESKGCQWLGKPNRYGDTIVNHTDTYLLNNPDRYDTTLCEAGQVGCKAYKDNSNAVYYFRDPGAGVCEYRQGYNNTWNWWQKKVNRCDDNKDKTITHTSSAAEGKICARDEDCATGVSCILDNWDTACETDKDEAPKTIGIGGAGNRVYQPKDIVGLCPAAESGCTEIIDPVSQPSPNLLNIRTELVKNNQTVKLKQNTLYAGSKDLDIENPVPQKFFYLDPAQNKLLDNTPPNAADSWLVFSNNETEIVVNPKSSATYFREALVSYQLASGLDTASCNGQPNYADGCVLFNARSVNGNGVNSLVYNADLSESKKESATQQLATCSGANCNSNSILKVQHDRVCSEWLACRSYALVDNSAGKNQKTCYDIGTCDGLDESNQCRSWVSADKKNQTIDLENPTTLSVDKGINKDLIANMTGYSQAGFWNGNVNANSSTEGSFALGSMEQTGDLAIVPNGNFEITNTEGVPSGWVLWDNPAGAEPVKKEIKTNMVSVISTPQEAQKLSIAYPIEGHNLLSLGVAFALQSQTPLEVSPNNKNYTITAQVNTKSLTSGTGHIIVYGTDDSGNKGAELANLSQAAGVGWNQKFGRFDTDSYKNIVIVIQTTNDNSGKQATGNMFVDNIQIRPTLITRLAAADKYGSTNVGDYWYTQQSCRLYPQADSLSCDYIDDSSIRQKGWYGYCLQYDRAPGNPNACLLWWPVNMVRGDGVDEQVAAYSGRYPLYYCTEMEKDGLIGYSTSELNITQNGTCTNHDNGCNEGSGGGSIYDSSNNLIQTNINSKSPLGWSADCSVYDGQSFTTTLKLTAKPLFTLDEYSWFERGSIAEIYSFIARCGSQPGYKYSPKFASYCKQIIQPVDPVGQNKVWASRVREGSNLNLDCKDVLNNQDMSCRYESDLYPFGSIAYPSPIDNPTQWISVDVNSRRPLIAEEADGQARFRYVLPVDQLKYAFIKNYGTWSWAWNGINQYQKQSGVNAVEFPIMTTLCNPGQHDLPGGKTNYCAIPPTISSANIKINGKTGVVQLATPNPLAHLTFTTNVDNDQLPLTEVRVNWGDGYTTSVSGVELRSRPSADEPFSYYHVYDYWDLLKKKGQKFNSTEIICADANQAVSGSPSSYIKCPADSPCCAVRPSIWIKDNWGWYSGDGSFGVPPTVPNKFGGTIIVKP
jgi:hypothetical protein